MNDYVDNPNWAGYNRFIDYGEYSMIKNEKFIEKYVNEYLKGNDIKHSDIDEHIKYYINLCVKETVMSYIRDKRYKDIEKDVKNKLDLIFEKGDRL